MIRQERPGAFARIRGGGERPCIRGIVRFYQLQDRVLVEAEISGLPGPDGFHGFHIHEGKSCQGTDFAATGSHYNPAKGTHPNHAGDLPPLLSCGGKAYLAVETDRFTLRQIIGRTVVIHSDRDDFTGQPSGNSGRKIACGVICQA